MDRHQLKAFLDHQVTRFDAGYLSMDPLEIVRRYADPPDQEIAGFIAAMLALGRADPIRQTVRDVLERMGASPSQFVRQFDPIHDRAIFYGFAYRFYSDRDLGLLIWWLHQIITQWGSLKALFLSGISIGDAHVGPAISHFVSEVKKLETAPFSNCLPEKGRGAGHFLADPADGGGCKRFNLFLRWMVRAGGVDLGIWPEIPARNLIIPLDTHVARLGQRLGFTRRRSMDWKMALEITESLKRLDPEDPVKYDFALCTIGKLNRCPETPDHANCRFCPIAAYCVMLS